MARFDYDVVIIGLGFGGSVAALRGGYLAVTLLFTVAPGLLPRQG